MGSIRIRLDARWTGLGTRDARAVGVEVSFTTFGGGATRAKPDEPQPAELVFHVAYLSTARGVSRPEYQKLATLAGSIVLEGAARRPVFVCDSAADFQYELPEPSDENPVRRIPLELSPASFRASPPPDGSVRKLRLPPDPDGARFMELGAELRIAGDVEAAREVNDIADMTLGPLELLQTRLPAAQLTGAAKIMMEGHFIAWLTTIFGHDVPHYSYLRLRQELLAETYRMPTIRVVGSLPRDHLAGYDNDRRTILVKRSLIQAAETDEDEAAVLLAALTEEFGHHVDNDLRTRLSTVGGDAELDEGARFGYLLCNLGWDLREEAEVATYLRNRPHPGRLAGVQAGRRSGLQPRGAAARRRPRGHRVLRRGSRRRARKAGTILRARVGRGCAPRRLPKA